MDTIFERIAILSKESSGEADKKVVMLGETRGKFSAVAPNIERSRKRFPSGLEFFILYEAELNRSSRRRMSNLIVVKSARPLVTYALTRDMQHYRLAARMTEIIDKVLPMRDSNEVFAKSNQLEEEPTKDLRNFFILLITAYATLDTHQPEEVNIVEAWFLWRLLILLGYGIEPFTCPRCGENYSETRPAMWCDTRHGLICSECVKKDQFIGCKPISIKALQLGQKLLNIPLPQGFAATVALPKEEKEIIDELLELLNSQLKLIIKVPLRTDLMLSSQKQQTD